MIHPGSAEGIFEVIGKENLPHAAAKCATSEAETSCHLKYTDLLLWSELQNLKKNIGDHEILNFTAYRQRTRIDGSKRKSTNH